MGNNNSAMSGVRLDNKKPRGRFIFTTAAVVGVVIVLISLFTYHAPTKALITGAAHTFDHDSLDDIRNATLGFQKIFVINLPSRTDHRDAMSLSASLTGLDLEYIDGVTEVAQKVLPPGAVEAGLNKGELGNWRAHMNIAQKMIEEKISSALILEDDVDWDIRIKEQMRDFARASRLLVQPLPGSDHTFLDPTYPEPSPNDSPTSFYVNSSATTANPTTSPYGDITRWDLLWLGHCGAYLPTASRSPNRPIGRAVISPDPTVPEPQHLGIQFGDAAELAEPDYPPHSRIVARANRNICTLAYGLSLPGARRLLHELGMKRLDGQPDVSFRSFCDGDKRPLPVALTVLPELFQQHRPAGSMAAYSDVGQRLDEINEKPFTRNIRWSTRLNLDNLLSGKTDYVDLYQDGQPAYDWGWG